MKLSIFGTNQHAYKEIMGMMRHLYVRGARIKSAAIQGDVRAQSLAGWQDAKNAL